MDQGIQVAINMVMPAVMQTGLIVSLFTAQEPRPTQGPNGVIEYDYVDVVGLVNLPCLDAPPSDARIQATEVRALEDITSAELRHVLLAGYYPALDAGWRGEAADGKGAWICVIADNDGSGNPINPVAYEIAGVESGSQRIQTRVTAKLATV
jgi:hypothetical protein